LDCIIRLALLVAMLPLDPAIRERRPVGLFCFSGLVDANRHVLIEEFGNGLLNSASISSRVPFASSFPIFPQDEPNLILTMIRFFERARWDSSSHFHVGSLDDMPQRLRITPLPPFSSFFFHYSFFLRVVLFDLRNRTSRSIFRLFLKLFPAYAGSSGESVRIFPFRAVIPFSIGDASFCNARADSRQCILLGRPASWRKFRRWGVLAPLLPRITVVTDFLTSLAVLSNGHSPP